MNLSYIVICIVWFPQRHTVQVIEWIKSSALSWKCADLYWDVTVLFWNIHTYNIHVYLFKWVMHKFFSQFTVIKQEMIEKTGCFWVWV